MATESVTFLFNAKDNASKTVAKLESNVKGLQKTSMGLGKMMAGVAGGVSIASAFGKAWQWATKEAERGLQLFLDSGRTGSQALKNELSALGKAWDDVLIGAFEKLQPALMLATKGLRVFLNTFTDIFNVIGQRVSLFFVKFGNEFTHFFTQVIPAQLDHARKILFEDMSAVFEPPKRIESDLEISINRSMSDSMQRIMREFNRIVPDAGGDAEKSKSESATRAKIQQTPALNALESRVMSGRVMRRDYAKEVAEAAKQQIQQNKQQIDVMKLLLRSMDDTKKAINAWTLEAVNI